MYFKLNTYVSKCSDVSLRTTKAIISLLGMKIYSLNPFNVISPKYRTVGSGYVMKAE